MFYYCCLCIFIVRLCILIVVYVFLLFVYVFLSLSMYSYVFLDAATLPEVFRAFSSVVRQMPGYNSPRRGTARTLPKWLYCSMYCLFVSFCVLFVCKCVLYYCHRVTTQFQLINISISVSIYRAHE